MHETGEKIEVLFTNYKERKNYFFFAFYPINIMFQYIIVNKKKVEILYVNYLGSYFLIWSIRTSMSLPTMFKQHRNGLTIMDSSDSFTYYARNINNVHSFLAQVL